MHVRRVVTGTDADGNSVVVSDGPAPVAMVRDDGYEIVELWMTDGTPPAVDGPDLAQLPFALEPPAGDLHWRVAVRPPGSGPGPLHRTNTVDLIYVISGEQYLQIGEDTEVHLTAGDSAVLRCAVHTWRNPAEQPCVFLATMVSAADPSAS